jgi:eukaryotic-like serine/threonine-protein kinase
MTDDSLLAELSEEFIAKIRDGKASDPEEYAARYPHLAQRIRELFPTLLVLEGMADAEDAINESPSSMLVPGTLLGRYRVEREIGRGGMGVVYLAEDVSLSRKVALKLLPDVLTGGPERMARFEREAKLLASLSHPNIAAIYGLEQSEGKRFFVLEYVKGETLQQRLSKGGLPVDEALGVCRQIAEALEAAHDNGIIHRDLKPANVMITNENKVKVLDFSLAKVLSDETGSVGSPQSPTITEMMTRSGVILGTAAYMSPEQAKGKPLDTRADIWAYGCIMFECLTGKRAFDGATISETLAEVLKGEPNWELLPREARANVQYVLKHCLQRDLNLRYRNIADAWLEIEAPAARIPVLFKLRSSFVWPVICAAVVLILWVRFGPALKNYFKPTFGPKVVTTINVEPGHILAGWETAQDMPRPTRTAMAMSSDGRFIIYSAVEEQSNSQARYQLYLRRMDQPEGSPIAGTEGGISPFLSPDDRWVGFSADGKLKKLPVEGGAATNLCDVFMIYGAHWGGKNTIIFADGEATGLSKVSAAGGKPEALTHPDPARKESSHRLPFWLPNEKAALFTVMRYSWDQHPWVALFQPDTREWSTLLEDAADARYVSTGHLVFLRRGTFMAVKFDLAKLRVIGQPVALAEDVMQTFSYGSEWNTSAGQFAFSDAGALIYATGGIAPDPQNSLVWVDQKGVERPAILQKLPFFAPRLSPDGEKIAYMLTGEEIEVWVHDLVKGTNSRLTSEGWTSFPIWTPNGERILFQWQDSPEKSLFWQPYDGSSPMERIIKSQFDYSPGSWSADGKTVALATFNKNTDFDISLLDVESKSVKPFLNSQFQEQFPEFSPDGDWMAYASNESKRFEVYVIPFPNPGRKYLISSGGGDQPLWGKNGRQLFYRSQDQVWVVDIQTNEGFKASKPRLLFEKPGYAVGVPIRCYDLSLDGKSFLMVKLEQRRIPPVTEMLLVQNWFEELKRMVPW